jgi:ribosomal protein S18 acetylase RimI-like enzyme
MIIRDATVKDVTAIAELHADSWRSTYRAILSDDYLENEVDRERLALWQARLSGACQKTMFVMVAEANSTLAGFVCVFPDEDSVFGSFLDNLHVAPTMTGQGIGRKLLSEAARHLDANGSRSGLYLWVVEQNEKARRFYRRAGARVVGSRVSTMPDNRQVLTLRCYWDSLQTLTR